MKLYEDLPYTVHIHGKRYRVRPSFDRVLEAYDVLRLEWTDTEKINYLTWLLFVDKPKDKTEAVQAFFDQIVGSGKGQAPAKKVFDFNKDAPYIYSAFYQAYGLNLYERQDRNRKWFFQSNGILGRIFGRPLHWQEFIFLFQGLPKDTLMSEIMSIRMTDIPARTKYNSEMVDDLIRKKQAFSLEDKEDMQVKWLRVFNALKGMAE